MKLHIIYTDSEMLLSKKSYASWREMQNEFDDYKTSLGPWAEDEVVRYVAEEYSTLQPSAKAQVDALIHGGSYVEKITFADA